MSIGQFIRKCLESPNAQLLRKAIDQNIVCYYIYSKEKQFTNANLGIMQDVIHENLKKNDPIVKLIAGRKVDFQLHEDIDVKIEIDNELTSAYIKSGCTMPFSMPERKTVGLPEYSEIVLSITKNGNLMIAAV